MHRNPSSTVGLTHDGSVALVVVRLRTLVKEVTKVVVGIVTVVTGGICPVVHVTRNAKRK